jgi:diguanylate cyclase (GGDEF)-like protein/putative nucleotidyltransferase with HDIG domain
VITITLKKYWRNALIKENNRIFGIFSFFLCLLFIIQLTLIPVSAQTERPPIAKSVLILHADDQFRSTNIVIDKNIYSVLKNSPNLAIAIYSEYLENVRFNSVAEQNKITKMLQEKYARRNLDLIIVTEDTSWNFIEKNGDTLFPGIPVVFCGVTAGRFDPKLLKSNSTGNFKNVDIKTTIEDILKLQPDTKKIAVIIGASEQDRYYESVTRQAFGDYVNKVAADYIVGLSIEETKNRIAQLPPNTVVLYVSMFSDGAGQGFNPRDVIEVLRETTNAPIYGISDTYLGYGIVGGSLWSISDLSQDAVQSALQILNGKKPSEIPVKVIQNKNYFDWAEMKQWGIDEINLPTGSILINKKLSAWDTYKTQIISIIIFLLIETLLILLLILQLSLKRKAEKKILQLNNELEGLVIRRTEQLESLNSQLEETNAELEETNAVLEEEIVERHKVEEEVRELNNDLENRVLERTNQLQEMNAMLEEVVVDRKKKEEENLYLSYHDVLTGLYNRRFYEEAIKRLDNQENLPISIIMADVNGLKLVNDAFGHYKGDELLLKAATAIQKACRKDDIAARWGGDEFVLLLPNTKAEEVEGIIEKIKAQYSNERVNTLSISISFGWDTKRAMDEDIQEILKSAEDYMYKHKIVQNEGTRGNTINTIIYTLHEKNPREERHSKRVSEICQKIGKALGFTEIEVSRLKVVGLLHDIGKIAIEEGILNKPGKLTQQERDEIMRHPDIGYRILSSSYEMQDIADCILAHHERWDGAGYPKGLKAEAIPKVARIVALADTYDAMTSERSYRKPLSENEVLAEIRNNAGSQFDPEIARVFVEKVLDKQWADVC